MNAVGYRDHWPNEWPDWPQDPKARKVVGGLYELGLWILNAPASLRKSRLEEADKKAQHYLSQLADEERERARALVALWEQNALIQQSIRYEEEKKGIDAVEHLRIKWDSSGMQMHKAEEEALQLGLTGHEYFRSRVEHFHIVQKGKDEVGRYHNFPDYSKLREQWYSRKPITTPLPWPWDEMLMLCKQFEVSGHKTKEMPVGRKFTILGIVLGAAGIIVTVIVAVIDKF